MDHRIFSQKERSMQPSVFFRLSLLAPFVFLQACSLPLPAWFPLPLKKFVTEVLSVKDLNAPPPVVTSEEVDGKLPPNSVTVNQKILDEMVRVVFLREPLSSKEFAGLLDVLNQGASFEGVYNGLVHSVEYRQLEEKGKPVLPATLSRFSEEWTLLQIEIPPQERTVLSDLLALPLAPIESPQEGDSSDTSGASDSKGAPPAPEPSYASKDDERRSIQRKTEETFLRSNVLTMKRVIGSEVFKVFNTKRSDRNQLADWYAKWCSRTSELGVDFSYPQRNDSDVDFHREWAWNASTDRLQWEVLYRLHRLLNEAEAKR